MSCKRVRSRQFSRRSELLLAGCGPQHLLAEARPAIKAKLLAVGSPSLRAPCRGHSAQAGRRFCRRRDAVQAPTTSRICTADLPLCSDTGAPGQHPHRATPGQHPQRTPQVSTHIETPLNPAPTIPPDGLVRQLARLCQVDQLLLAKVLPPGRALLALRGGSRCEQLSQSSPALPELGKLERQPWTAAALAPAAQSQPALNPPPHANCALAAPTCSMTMRKAKGAEPRRGTYSLGAAFLARLPRPCPSCSPPSSLAAAPAPAAMCACAAGIAGSAGSGAPAPRAAASAAAFSCFLRLRCSACRQRARPRRHRA